MDSTDTPKDPKAFRSFPEPLDNNRNGLLGFPHATESHVRRICREEVLEVSTDILRSIDRLGTQLGERLQSLEEHRSLGQLTTADPEPTQLDFPALATYRTSRLAGCTTASETVVIPESLRAKLKALHRLLEQLGRAGQLRSGELLSKSEYRLLLRCLGDCSRETGRLLAST